MSVWRESGKKASDTALRARARGMITICAASTISRVKARMIPSRVDRGDNDRRGNRGDDDGREAVRALLAVAPRRGVPAGHVHPPGPNRGRLDAAKLRPCSRQTATLLAGRERPAWQEAPSGAWTTLFKHSRGAVSTIGPRPPAIRRSPRARSSLPRPSGVRSPDLRRGRRPRHRPRGRGRCPKRGCDRPGPVRRGGPAPAGPGARR